MSVELFKKISSNVENNKHSWLATIIYSEGSTPARVGMKMLVENDGQIVGTIGGGAVEKRVIDKIVAEKPINSGRWAFDLDGNDSGVLACESTGMICGGVLEVLIEPLFNVNDLYVIGGGHCGKALTELAAKCGFAVTIIDDRAEIADKKNHKYAHKVICAPYADITRHIKFSPEVYIVAMTHGHKHDMLLMEKIVRKNYKYFGVIGSKNKVKIAFERLLAKGFSKKELQKIYSPIGFPIGSQTPMEVAVSIMAQLIAVRSGKNSLVFSSNVLLP